MNIFLLVFVAYTMLIFAITYVTSRRAGSDAFYIGSRRSPWLVVAFGMIGASLSGVTFISLPGNVLNEKFYYLPMVFGFIVGYAVIALVLLPLYYKMNLTSVYTYLEQRFGKYTYKTGAAFFILSRMLVTSLRLFLVVNVLHIFVLQQFGIPMWLVAVIFISLIVLYTFKGGIKTIVWTDLLQTVFMLLAVVVSMVLICGKWNWGFGEMMARVSDSGYARVFDTEPMSRTFWIKQFIGGLFVCIAMTGLDQEMMQKNLSCRNLRSAQKNMFTFSGILLLVNAVFLFLGALLAIYVQQKGLSFGSTDIIFPTIATHYLGTFAGLLFFIGLLSAAYPSADGALTSITTSFCIDIIGTEKKTDWAEQRKKKVRYMVHFCFAGLLLLLTLLFTTVKHDAVITLLYTVTSYTYGPLLGFFFFGLFTKRHVCDRYIPLLAIFSPVFCFLFNALTTHFLGFGFGFSLLLLNGLVTFCGMWLLRTTRTV